VRCLLNPFGIWGRLVFAYHDRYELCVSPPILQELLEVIERPLLKRKYRLTQGRGIERLLEIVARSAAVEISDVAAVSRDPNDDMFLATAVVAGADFVVSEDRDLLDVMEYQGIKIIDAATFLRMLESL
jgi:uncharacterized protein